MRIDGNRLREAMERAGVEPAALAEAVDRTGLEGPRARRAVANWLAGRDHPRCKSSDIAKLARALGCAPRDIARFSCCVRFQRGSPQKARLVVDLVRGRRVDEALNLLAFTPNRAAVHVRKALQAAMAEAEQAEADLANLVVVESRVDDGPRIKRFRPKDRGRAHPILKRTGHITIGLEERG